MVNMFSLYDLMLRFIIRFVGLKRQKVEIKPGTIINFWVPKSSPNTTPDRPNIVFLHSFAANGIFTWQFQALALARKYSLYIPDFLFFGDSTTESRHRTLDFQAECMAEGLRKLGVKKCTVVGLSYGGMAAFKMAEKYPELVESLVLTGTVMALTESVSEDCYKRLGISRWADLLLPTTVKGMKNMMDAGTYKLPSLPDWVFKDFLEVMFSNRQEKEELLEALVIPDKKFQIPRFSQRVHLLWGENDKIFNMDIANSLKEKLGEKATLEYIEKSGHLVPVERPFAYNQRLKKILYTLFNDKSK